MPRTFRGVSFLMACCMLSGCATSHIRKNHALIEPGVTTREEVQALFGEPNDVVKGQTSETLVFVERGRSSVKGGLIGASAFGAAVAVPSIALAPFTLGISLIAIPAAAIVGAIGGAVAGAFIEVDKAKMIVEVGPDGKVVKSKFVPLK